MRRAAIAIAGVVAGWLLLLLVLGLALGSRQERHTTERLGESLQAQVRVDASDLALVRGRWTLDGLSIRHDDVLGKLWVDVASVRCELAPLGWVFVDRDCRELAVRGVRMDVASLAPFKAKRPKRKPVHADRIVIDDAVLVFSPTAIAPSLGRVEIAIDHAESGSTRLRTPLSWLLTLQELRARISLPGGVALKLGYEHGVLTAEGSLLGAAPVTMPLTLPTVDPAADGKQEMQAIVEVGKGIAERLVARRAADWLQSKLRAQAQAPASGGSAAPPQPGSVAPPQPGSAAP